MKMFSFHLFSHFYKGIFKNNQIFKLQFIYVKCVAILTGQMAE